MHKVRDEEDVRDGAAECGVWRRAREKNENTERRGARKNVSSQGVNHSRGNNLNALDGLHPALEFGGGRGPVKGKLRGVRVKLEAEEPDGEADDDVAESVRPPPQHGVKVGLRPKGTRASELGRTVGEAYVFGDVIPPRPEALAELLAVEVLEETLGELAGGPDVQRDSIRPVGCPRRVVRGALRWSEADGLVRIESDEVLEEADVRGAQFGRVLDDERCDVGQRCVGH
jgi:hypothetical protein